jgi:hypothetical protein
VNPIALIFAVVFGIAAYQEANRFARRYGRTPFGWAPIVWGVICFLSFIIGIVLLAIAERSGRRNPGPAQFAQNSYAQPVNASQPYGQPAYGQPNPFAQPQPYAAPQPYLQPNPYAEPQPSVPTRPAQPPMGDNILPG